MRRTLDQEPDSFVAEYDPELGYPSFVSADIDFQIADEEFSFRVEALEAVVP